MYYKIMLSLFPNWLRITFLNKEKLKNSNAVQFVSYSASMLKANKFACGNTVQCREATSFNFDVSIQSAHWQNWLHVNTHKKWKTMINREYFDCYFDSVEKDLFDLKRFWCECIFIEWQSMRQLATLKWQWKMCCKSKKSVSWKWVFWICVRMIWIVSRVVWRKFCKWQHRFRMRCDNKMKTILCSISFRTKQDKLDADLDRLNQEHSAESRNDCQRMVNKSTKYLTLFCLRRIISVFRCEGIHRSSAFDQKTNDKHSSKSETIEGKPYT